jgi:hypothetical protein
MDSTKRTVDSAENGHDSKDVKKRWSCPYNGESRLSHFLDNRLRDGGEIVSHTHFGYRLSRPQVHSESARIRGRRPLQQTGVGFHNTVATRPLTLRGILFRSNHTSYWHQFSAWLLPGRLILPPWKWKQRVPRKHQQISTRLHGAMPCKILLLGTLS